jgi:ribonuclease HII
MLKRYYKKGIIEAGCDEAGRGPLAGPVFAAAVILPPDFHDPTLDDSKKLSHPKREELRKTIEQEALYWAVAQCSAEEIDKINILNASILAMQRAVDLLGTQPAMLLIDGNRFHAHRGIPHTCIIRGDGLYQSIAAASILAKTYRDDYMREIHTAFPHYHWDRNKGYPTAAHCNAIREFGLTPHHRKSFRYEEAWKLPFEKS